MIIPPEMNSDDPQFRHDGSTLTQRLETGDYYAADNELSTLVKCAVRFLSLYEQTRPTDLDIAAYLLAQVLRQVGDSVDIRPPLRADHGYNIPIGDGSWVNHGLIVLDIALVVIGADVLVGPNYSFYAAIHPSELGPRRARWESSVPTILEDNV